MRRDQIYLPHSRPHQKLGPGAQRPRPAGPTGGRGARRRRRLSAPALGRPVLPEPGARLGRLRASAVGPATPGLPRGPQGLGYDHDCSAGSPRRRNGQQRPLRARCRRRHRRLLCSQRDRGQWAGSRRALRQQPAPPRPRSGALFAEERRAGKRTENSFVARLFLFNF